MLDPNFKLTVLHDDNSSFTDFSREAFDYARDPFTLTLHNTQDYLYFGYEKPINAVYFSFETANTVTNTLTFEFWNGTAWTAVEDSHDDTIGWTRDGYLRWQRNQTDQASIEVDSITKFFYRLRPSVEHSATIIRGLSIVFSDDQDLKNEFFEIDQFFPGTETSHIVSHVSARNEIIQKIRNDGRTKTNLNTGVHKNINMWDLLEAEDIRQAATFLTLSKIFLKLSDAPDDIYSARANIYRGRYNKSIALFFLELDVDDDGLKDRFEELGPVTPILVRR